MAPGPIQAAGYLPGTACYHPLSSQTAQSLSMRGCVMRCKAAPCHTLGRPRSLWYLLFQAVPGEYRRLTPFVSGVLALELDL
jgi:hypothetical protein